MATKDARPDLTQLAAEGRTAITGPRNGEPALNGLVPRGTIPAMRCRATSSMSGEQCKRWAIVGGTVCPFHGGSIPHVREAARKRLLAFVPVAIEVMQHLATDETVSDAVRQRASADLLDRAGYKAVDVTVEVSSEQANGRLDDAIAQALGDRGLLPPDSPEPVIDVQSEPDETDT